MFTYQFKKVRLGNLFEHVFEGFGCVKECVSWFQKHTLESNSFINVEIFNNLLLHDLFYTFIVFLGDIPSFSIFSVIKWIIFIFLFNFIMSTIGVICNIQWIPKLLMASKNIIHVYVISIYLFFVSKLSQVDIDIKT